MCGECLAAWGLWLQAHKSATRRESFSFVSQQPSTAAQRKRADYCIMSICSTDRGDTASVNCETCARPPSGLASCHQASDASSTSPVTLDIPIPGLMESWYTYMGRQYIHQ
nr:hypothetical protein CFP56_77515 [Quercus suber]